MCWCTEEYVGYMFWRKSKNVVASETQFADSMLARLSEWPQHGTKCATEQSRLSDAWAPSYFPTILLALSYDRLRPVTRHFRGGGGRVRAEGADGEGSVDWRSIPPQPTQGVWGSAISALNGVWAEPQPLASFTRFRSEFTGCGEGAEQLKR